MSWVLRVCVCVSGSRCALLCQLICVLLCDQLISATCPTCIVQHLTCDVCLLPLVRLWQVLAQESENPLFSKHSSALCAVVTQLLHLHELLHCRASMQGMLVVILACLDSILWLDCLLSDAAVLQAVFEVLVNDSGFEEEVEAEEALQGQEAAWAVLAVVTKHVDTADTSMQVT